MAEALVNQFRKGVGKGHAIEEIILIPSGGGCFEVVVDGKVVYSKRETGRHATIDEVVEAVEGLKS